MLEDEITIKITFYFSNFFPFYISDVSGWGKIKFTFSRTFILLYYQKQDQLKLVVFLYECKLNVLFFHLFCVSNCNLIPSQKTWLAGTQYRNFKVFPYTPLLLQHQIIHNNSKCQGIVGLQTGLGYTVFKTFLEGFFVSEEKIIFPWINIYVYLFLHISPKKCPRICKPENEILVGLLIFVSNFL